MRHSDALMDVQLDYYILQNYMQTEKYVGEDARVFLPRSYSYWIFTPSFLLFFIFLFIFFVREFL